MYRFEIQEQLELLKDAGLIKESDISKAIEVLQEKYWNDKIAILWNTEDVRSLDENLTEEQAKAVLDIAVDRFDANLGINWDALEYYISELPKDPAPKKEEENKGLDFRHIS